MFAFPDPLVALHRQSLECAQALTMASFAGLEKLTQLNVQAAKASVEEGIQRSMALLETRDVKALAETFTEAVTPSSDKVTAYAKHVYDIASQTRAEMASVIEKQLTEGNRQLVAAFDVVGKSSPVAPEGVLTLVKSAISAANATWDQVNQASRQAMDQTDANVAAATDEVLAASASASSAQAGR